LPEATREALQPKLLRESLTSWQLLRDEREPVTRVYFPIDAILSIVSLTEDGSIGEAYTAGRDGLAGAETLLGGDRLIFRTMCQVPGVVYSISPDNRRRATCYTGLRSGAHAGYCLRTIASDATHSS
jgi:hypothetical protein